MLSKIRVKKTFRFQRPDRPAIFDIYRKDTIARWYKEGLPSASNPMDYFDHDIRLFGFDQSMDSGAFKFEPSLIDSPSTGERLSEAYRSAKEKGKFLSFSFLGPFEQIRRIYTTETVLEKMASEPAFIKALFLKSARLTISSFRAIGSMGYSFDGAWMWEDIAYNRGLLFSVGDYRDKLLKPHKMLCDFFKGIGMPTIMHADGDLNELIPHLLMAGVGAVHPLESAAGMDLARLIDGYDKRMVLVGNVDISIMRCKKAKLEEGLKGKLKEARKTAGYIYSSDQPISPDVPFKNYISALEIIRGEEGLRCR